MSYFFQKQLAERRRLQKHPGHEDQQVHDPRGGGGEGHNNSDPNPMAGMNAQDAEQKATQAADKKESLKASLSDKLGGLPTTKAGAWSMGSDGVSWQAAGDTYSHQISDSKVKSAAKALQDHLVSTNAPYRVSSAINRGSEAHIRFEPRRESNFNRNFEMKSKQ